MGQKNTLMLRIRVHSVAIGWGHNSLKGYLHGEDDISFKFKGKSAWAFCMICFSTLSDKWLSPGSYGALRGESTHTEAGSAPTYVCRQWLGAHRIPQPLRTGPYGSIEQGTATSVFLRKNFIPRSNSLET